MTHVPTPDARFSDHGSIILMTPLSQAAKDWIKEHLPQEVIWFGDAIAIEPRYAGDIFDGLIADGLTLSIA